MGHAQKVSDKLAFQSVEYWESIISGCLKCHRPKAALSEYQKMPKKHSFCLSGRTFVSLIKACVHLNDSARGIEIHEHVAKLGLLDRDLYVSSSLIDMYIKCGLLTKAEQVLHGLPARNVVSWTTLIVGYVDNGHCEKALECFRQMQSEGISANALTFVYCLKACCILSDTNSGDKIHFEIARYGLHENLFVGTTLVDMYAKCGSLNKALQVFEKLENRNVVSWTALIAGYAERGSGERALHCYEHMLLEGIIPNAITFACTLKACASSRAIEKGQELHAGIEMQGLLAQDLMIGVTLVDMYGKCGWLARAQQVFDNLHNQNVVLWNALITGYVEHGYADKALHCLEYMQQEGVSPDPVTILCSLKACSKIRALAKGQELHIEAERQGLLEKDLAIANTLVDMYAKCGLLTMAQHVFDKLPNKNIVAWNALIAGYAGCGFSHKVVELFEGMQQENVCPDSVSYLCGLKACGTIEDVVNSGDLLNQVINQGPGSKDIYVGSTLVNVYAKRGNLVKAQEVFDELLVRDVVAWNALAAGYAEHGRGEEALKCLEKMQAEGFSPNAVTFLCSLKACSSIGAVDKGQDIHVEIERQGLLERELIGNTLVDMYAKCGLPAMAHQVFDKLKVQDVVSWTALMAGYGQRGESNVVFHIFDKMVGTGVKPNPVTLVVVLSACNRACLFSESQNYFESISKNYGVPHTIKHHACMVDLFGRAGYLDNARSMVNKMPFNPNLVVWHIMLGACKGLGNAGFGSQAFEHALQLYAHDVAIAISQSQGYAPAMHSGRTFKALTKV